MKSSKSMKRAVLSLIGGKKKTVNTDDSQRVIEDNNQNLKKSNNRFANQDSSQQRRLPRRTQSCLGGRTTSLPAATRQRIEEWNSKASPEFEPDIEEGMKRTLSVSSRRSHEVRSLKLPPRKKSLATFDGGRMRFRCTESVEDAEITPWDCASGASSQMESLSHRDSGTFDMYVNEDIVSNELSGEIENQLRPSSSSNLKRYLSDTNLYRVPASRNVKSTRLPARTASFTNQRSTGLKSRSLSRTSNASERLLSCMDTLEHLSKRLASINKVSSEVERFQQASEVIESASSPPVSKRVDENLAGRVDAATGRVNWRIGEKSIPRGNADMEDHRRNRSRRKSCESSSTDSGINCGYESGNKRNAFHPSSRPKHSKPDHIHASVEKRPKIGRRGGDHYLQQPSDDSYVRSNSLSSGYSSGSGGNYNRLAPINYYPHSHPAATPISHEYGQKSFPAPDPYQVYGYGPGYSIEEDPYGYGSYGYASSSIYDEELPQHNGWFYLPTAANGAEVTYQSPTAQYGQKVDYFPTPSAYPVQSMCFPSKQSFRQNQHRMEAANQSLWQAENYGALSDAFLDPSSRLSALGSAISATYAGNYPSSIASDGTERRKFGSFRYRNGERTAVVPSNSDSMRRRKTVRFSQTVKQRIETDESEMEDSTSLIKGEDGTFESKYDSPSSLKAADFSTNNGTPSLEQTANTLTEQPIYEFPAGHIESSCMCSDCVLARQTCVLQPPASFAYY